MQISNFASINRAATLKASETLSALVKIPVTIKAVHLEIKKIGGLFNLANPETPLIAIEAPVSGDIKGTTMLLMPKETALGLASLLLKKEPVQEITGMAEKALKELANIVIGNYLQAFAKRIKNKTLLHGISRISSGPYSSLARTLMPIFLPHAGEGLLIEVTFGFRQSVLKGYLIFVFAGVGWGG